MPADAPKRRWVSQEVKEGLAVARTLRAELDLRDEQPVDCLVHLAEERLAMDVVVVPLRDAVSGLYLPTRPRPVVILSDAHPVARQRFTLAHEVAHHALGHGAAPRIQEAAAANPTTTEPETAPESHYTPQRQSDPDERAANAFAGELLAPDAGALQLAAAWADERPLDQAVRLSSHYGISAFAASVKLEMVGLHSKPTSLAVRDELRRLRHVARYDELALPALDDQLQRHRDAGGGIRCAPRARSVVRRLLAELDAA